MRADFNGIFPYKPSSYWGPPSMESPMFHGVVMSKDSGDSWPKRRRPAISTSSFSNFRWRRWSQKGGADGNPKGSLTGFHVKETRDHIHSIYSMRESMIMIMFWKCQKGRLILDWIPDFRAIGGIFMQSLGSIINCLAGSLQHSEHCLWLTDCQCCSPYDEHVWSGA